MSEASDADRLEQQSEVVPPDEEAVGPLEPEVPVEDAIEQHQPLPSADEEYEHG